MKRITTTIALTQASINRSLHRLPTWINSTNEPRDELHRLAPRHSPSEPDRPMPLPPRSLAAEPIESMQIQLGDRSLHLFRGSIAHLSADAIVNAANARLIRGGGVDHAVHEAAGRELQRFLIDRYPEGCETGHAVTTPSFGLRANGVKHLIHAVGPQYARCRDHEEACDLLRSTYQQTLEQADGCGCVSVALPSLSTGVYGFPADQAAPIALATASAFLSTAQSVREITFVVFDRTTTNAFADAFTQLQATHTAEVD